MSLGRVFGLAIVAIWLIVALCFAIADVSILADPMTRRAEHVCVDDFYTRNNIPGADLSEKECFPQLAMRAGFDVLMVGLPMMAGLALTGRPSRR